jgi:hypothetical protein
MSSLKRRKLLWLLGLLLACGGQPPPPASPPPEAARTTFRVLVPERADEAIRVEACARGFAPTIWRSIGVVNVVEARSGGAPLPIDDAGAVRLPRESACIDYVVRPLARGGVSPLVAGAGAFFGGHGAVFLRPEPRPAELDIEVRFEAPEGVEVSAAWPTIDGVGRPDATFFDRESHLAFGSALAVRRFEWRGTEIERARLPGTLSVTDEALDRALERAIAAVASVAGRFPRARVQIVVLPVPARDEAVPFGLVRRGGGPSVMLLVSERADFASIERSWVVTHELSHLLFPLIDRRDAWISEGLATYYQEVLRARAGLIDPREAFERLERGFARGRRASGAMPLELESARMGEAHNYQRIYWSGAAFALLVDVELRGRGTSLDALVTSMGHELWEPRGRWNGRALLGALERPLEAPRLTSLAADLEASTSFPDLDDAYDALGLTVRADGALSFSEAAAARALREAIMSPRRVP